MPQLLALGMGWLAGGLALSAQACPFNIAFGDQASPPYYFGDGDTIAEKPGIAVDLLTLAAARMGCKIEWKRLPGRRALRELESGNIDAMLLLSYTPERAAYAAFPMLGDAPDPAFSLANLRYSVFVKSGDPLRWDSKQFSPTPTLVGANAGYSVVAELQKLKLNVEEAPSTTNNIQKLLMGRISAYVGQDLQTDLVLEAQHITSVQKLPVPFSSKDYYLPFSLQFVKRSQPSALQLWKQIAEVRKTHGKELAKKYFELN